MSINVDELFFGKFYVGDREYEVTEDDYLLIDALDEYTDAESLSSAAKHVAIQRNGSTGQHTLQNLQDSRGDYHFSQDPIDWEGVVLVFDGNNMAHRARHTSELSFKGQDVSVSYGVLNIIAATIKKFRRVSSVIVCWDGGVPKFRYDRVPSYKQRDHSDDELYQEFIRQVKELHQVLPSFGVYSLQKSYTEADDLIYHACRLVHPDYQKVIISTDQDLYQCVTFDTVVWQPNKEILITPNNFLEHTGVKVADYLVYRSMVGDNSDGIPGIKGIGRETALKLIAEYGASPSNLVNVASGANPTVKPMSDSIASKIMAYGLKGFGDTMTAIRLDVDRCGCKSYIAEALRSPLSFDAQVVNNYLKKYAFASLMSAQFYENFKALSRPIQSSAGVRFPRMFEGARQPVS